MVAPIVEKGATQRNVYFPEFNWVDLQHGITYTPGTHIIENKLTDPVPIFVREGSIVATQDTTKVRSTKDLDSGYLLSMAMHHDTRRSNSTHEVYEAVGSVLSVKDYSDATLIDLCIRNGCNYIFNAVATINSLTRSLELDILYIGNGGLNQEVQIWGINIAFGKEVVVIRPSEAIKVTGPKRVTLPIPRPGDRKSVV